MKLARAPLVRAAIPGALLMVLLVWACVGPAPRNAGRASTGLRIRAPRLEDPLTDLVPPPSFPSDPVKRAVFGRVNEDRASAGLAPVDWDARAAAVADAFCARQVEERTRGHYLTDGVPPYARTGFAGIFGLQSENSASWVTTGSKFDEPSLNLALSAQREMMGEKPPRDGHRKTILDPEATHVGIGYALAGGRFQLAQEFLARSLQRLTLAADDPRRGSVRFEGRPLANHRLAFVMVAREREPRPLTRAEATGRTTYSYPRADVAYLPEGQILSRVEGVANEPRVQIRRSAQFSFLFEPERPGLYTLVFYVFSGTERARPGASATLWVESGGP